MFLLFREGCLIHKYIVFAALALPFCLFSYEKSDVEDFLNGSNERKEEKISQQERVIKQISEKYCLIFFYWGEQDKASNEASRYLQLLSEKYEWLTYAISMDGIMVEGFENNAIDNGNYEEFRNKSNAVKFKGPNLFLFNPNNKDIFWIVSGSSDFKKLEDKIYKRYIYFGL